MWNKRISNILQQNLCRHACRVHKSVSRIRGGLSGKFCRGVRFCADIVQVEYFFRRSPLGLYSA